MCEASRCLFAICTYAFGFILLMKASGKSAGVSGYSWKRTPTSALSLRAPCHEGQGSPAHPHH